MKIPRRPRVKDDGSSSSSTYSIVHMPGFKMDLHKKQQDIILGELTASRQKLAEDNQMLRDELAEAKMIIRLLKMKLDESREAMAVMATENAINSQETSVRQGNQVEYARASEHPKADPSKKRSYLFKRKSSSRRQAFLNPKPPGSRTFQSRARSLTPPQRDTRISPRSSFSPIKDQVNGTAPSGEQGRVSAFSDNQIQDVTARMQMTRIHNISH